jgi:hypothetical protein
MKSKFEMAMQHLVKVIWLSHIPRDEWTAEDSLSFTEAQGFVRDHSEESSSCGVLGQGIDPGSPKKDST